MEPDIPGTPFGNDRVTLTVTLAVLDLEIIFGIFFSGKIYSMMYVEL